MTLASAVLPRAALTLSGVQVGCAWMTSAAEPVVMGAAIEVPDSVVPFQPDPTRVDRMFTPGAATSGRRALSPQRGPDEEKLAIWPNVGFGWVPALRRVIAPPSS